MTDSRDSQQALEYFSRALRLSFLFLKVLVGALLLYYVVFSGFFTVKQDEVAVILRWGRIVGVGEGRVLRPGFHWSFPEPIDKLIRIPIKRVKSLELKEFWSPDLDKKNLSPPPFLVPYLHGYCVTGDSNLIHTRWHVEYRITDPLLYLLSIEEEESLITGIVSNAIIETIGSYSVDKALRTHLEKISQQVRRKAQRKFDALGSGISLVAVYLDRSVPPLQVAQAFNEVIRAEQIKSSRINEAKSYRNRVINTAKGEASKIIAEANTYKSEVVNESRADAEYIQKLTSRFKEGSKELNTYLSYFYQERIEAILSNLEGKFILQRPVSEGKNELRIILGKEKRWEGVK
ncbi:MAG TPA: FtsH protease activity modulator HflK [Candidatus Omnitrophica bacterium]|nr:FtsH protease activity modulator HflK [Candidatus Omnitrophota bacterium]